MFHQKRNGVATLAATKTFENFFGRRNGERWRPFVMKRAVSEVVGAPLFKLNKATYYIYNVKAGKNLLYGSLRYHEASNIARAGNKLSGEIQGPKQETRAFAAATFTLKITTQCSACLPRIYAFTGI
jgi:hypothetical protein